MTVRAHVHNHTITIPAEIEIEDGQEVIVIFEDSDVEQRRKRWACAAELAAEDYKTDAELTVFTALDSDEFHEES